MGGFLTFVLSASCEEKKKTGNPAHVEYIRDQIPVDWGQYALRWRGREPLGPDKIPKYVKSPVVV